MLTKTETTAAIEIAPNGSVTVVTHINVMDGDTLISQTAHRHNINPGDDYSDQPEVVQAVCEIVQTAAVIAAYQSATA